MTTWTLARRILLACALLACRPGVSAADIFWYQDLKQASAAAQQANLPMFIDFWADWCAPCKVMDAEVYTDPRVIRAFEGRIIGVRLHFDLQPDLTRRFNVPALPFLVFTNSYGTALLYQRGIIEAEDLARVVQAIPPMTEINRIDRALQEDRNDFVNVLAMARTLRGAGFYETSNGFYDRASKHNAAKRDADSRESILYDMSLNWIELQDGRQAASTLERILKDFSKSTRRADVLLALGRAYTIDEKPDRARRALNSVITEFPQSAAARQAQALLKLR
jgi:thioredoxin-like negative regulator of GroEL